MSKKLKHSKIKNTSILFELLTRQITADVLADKTTKTVGIVKKFFNEQTELGKELQLYKILSEKKYNSTLKANQLLETVIKSRNKLSNSKLRREKYNLIKAIKENYNVDDFMNARINNYKLLASIYNIFQSETTNEQFNPEHIVNSKFTILENIAGKKQTSQNKETFIAEYKQKDKDLRLLAYQILVDKFNSKYKTLDESQKKLLKNYINNISNTNSLREFVDSEIVKVKKRLKTELPKVKDDITQIKLTEVINQIDALSKGKLVTEKKVLNLMRYYELVKEINNVHETRNIKKSN